MISFWTLVVFMCFSSFAFGCMEPWSIATCEVILFVGAGLAGWKDKNFWRWPKHLGLPALLVLSLVVVGVIQLIPLPVSVWRHFKAERVLIYDEGAQAEMLLRSDAYRRDPFGPDADKPLPPDTSPLLTPKAPDWIPATFTPMATARGLIAVLAAGCLIMLLQKVSEDARALKALALIVGILGLLVALMALAQYTEKPSEILWVRPSQYAKQAFGPFVNPNHGAEFIALAFPILYFLLWRKSNRVRRGTNRWGLRILTGTLFGVHLAVAALSHSRGPALSLSLYPLAILASLASRRGGRLWAVPAVAYLMLLVGAGAAGMATGLISDHGRLQMNANVPWDHVILGNGISSFEARYPSIVTDLPLLPPMRNSHLENEYLQAYFEGGLVLGVLAVGAGLFFIRLAVRLALETSSGFWLAPALVGSVLHASVDFTMHVYPIVGLVLLVALIGLAEISTKHRGRSRGPAPRLESEP